MITDPGKLAQRFLNELKNSEDTVEALVQFMEVLENKPDPEMTEVRLVANITNLLELLRSTEQNIRSYVRESNEDLPSSKLSSLYDDLTSDGGSIYRD